MSNTTTNWFLGGFWKNGTVRGVNFTRGRWKNGLWQKGNFYSLDLDANYDGVNKNLWSIWSGGVWKSNSQNYTLNNYNIQNEWSVFRGGTWKSDIHTNQLYTWQGPFVNNVSIYGNFSQYDCDTSVLDSDTVTRTIFLPSPKSIWLGGQWLRGEFDGGIFANGLWQSIKYDTSDYAFLDDLNFFFGNAGETNTWQTTGTFIDDDNEGEPFDIYLFDDDQTLQDNLTDSYDIEISKFHRGAFVNSIFDGGTVTNNYSYFDTLFGMAISSNNSKIQDDSGLQNSIGFLESNTLLNTRKYGLPLLNHSLYRTNLNILHLNSDNGYEMPSNLNNGGVYSNIFKRGKFEKGVFMYSQFYEYDLDNNFVNSYTHLDINDFDTAYPLLPSGVYSTFEEGLIYKSIWYNGILKATNSSTSIPKIAFSKSEWMTGLWLADGTNNDFSNNRDITNARFFKSIWHSGIFTGGRSIMSNFLSGNVYNFDININNVNIPTNNTYTSNTLLNIQSNPLHNVSEYDTGSTIVNLNYYDSLGNITSNYQDYIDALDITNVVDSQLTSTFDSENPLIFATDENIAFFRHSGLVDNASSIIKNGSFEGCSFNGGYWLSGLFKPYTFADYPSNILDRATNTTTVQLDYFGNNVKNLTDSEKRQKGFWNRGLWYGGYMNADCLMFAVPAYQTNVDISTNLQHRLVLSDAIIQANFNNNSSSIISLKPVPHASMFMRRSIRRNTVNYISIMNGHMMSGLLYDIDKDAKLSPILGTTSFSLDETISYKANFGNIIYDTTVNPDAFPFDIPIINTTVSILIQNTSANSKFVANVATPQAYDPINNLFRYDLTNSQYTDMYYLNHSKSVVTTTGSNSSYDLRHTGNLLATVVAGRDWTTWTDIEPTNDIELALRIPSIAQGSGDIELYYE